MCTFYGERQLDQCIVPARPPAGADAVDGQMTVAGRKFKAVHPLLGLASARKALAVTEHEGPVIVRRVPEFRPGRGGLQHCQGAEAQ